MQKAEFGSDEWLDLYRKNNEELVAQLPPELHGLRWSLCPEFTDPPAHLDDGTGKIGWWISFVVPNVEVGRGERPDLGNKFRADYQSALPGIREIIDYSDEVLEQRVEEQRHGSEVAGAATAGPPPELVPLLTRAHNYMAERTA